MRVEEGGLGKGMAGRGGKHNTYRMYCLPTSSLHPSLLPILQLPFSLPYLNPSISLPTESINNAQTACDLFKLFMPPLLVI